MNTRVLKLAAAAVVALAGCASSSGVKVTDEQVAALQPGVTTEQDVLARFGQPSMRTRLADGTVMLMYHHAETYVKGATFVPVVGMMAGGMEVRSSAVTLNFDATGKLVSTASHMGQYGGGSTAPATPKQ